MKNIKWILFYSIILVLLSCKSAMEQPNNPVNFSKVQVKDRFLYPYLLIERDSLLPLAFDRMQKPIEYLYRLSELKKENGGIPVVNRFTPNELFMLLEGATAMLAFNYTGNLEAKLDSLYQLAIEQSFPQNNQNLIWDYKTPRTITSEDIYNWGLFMETILMKYCISNDPKYLKLAEQCVSIVERIFIDGHKGLNNGKPLSPLYSNEEIELALTKIYTCTHKNNSILICKKLIDGRGEVMGENIIPLSNPHSENPLKQQIEPIRNIKSALGLYTSTIEITRLTKDKSYLPMIDSISNNLINKRLFINGTISGSKENESFEEPYKLGNNQHMETCVAISLLRYYYRLCLLKGEGQYADLLESLIYNCLFASINLNASYFFYSNALESDGIVSFNEGKAERTPWLGNSCCPMSIVRFLPMLQGLIYAQNSNEIYCNLYIGNSTSFDLESGKTTIELTTEYPYGEKLNYLVLPENNEQEFSLCFRIPTWLGDKFLPSNLYQYSDDIKPLPWTITINGEQINTTVTNGYCKIQRKWKRNDKVVLFFPSQLRYTKADERLTDNLDKICITKGPLLYCAESVDNDCSLKNIVVNKQVNQPIKTRTDYPSLKGIEQLIIPICEKTEDSLIPRELSIIPYYAWNNRGKGSMKVWFPRK